MSEVDLSEKNIIEFPIIQNVKYLNLSKNNIKVIPTKIQTLQFLEKLNLNNNQIYKFPKIHMPRLHTLEISNNNLISTDFSFLNITYLDIQFNPFEIYTHTPTLQQLNLSWFLLIDMNSRQIDLQTTLMGKTMRQYKQFSFNKFVDVFSSFTYSVLIKAIQYDERSVIPSICEVHPDCVNRLFHPQPLILAAKLNIKIFQILLKYVEPNQIFIRFIFLWACNRFEVDVVQTLIQFGMPVWDKRMPVWEERMNIICQNVGSPMKAFAGDTPLHFVLRKHCRSESDYQNQHQLILMLRDKQDPNQKNRNLSAPIHELLQVPSLRTFAFCDQEYFNYKKRFGVYKDSLMHQACQMGFIQAVQLLADNNNNMDVRIRQANKVSMFCLNKQNKTPKQKCSPSVTLLKYVRKLEFIELKSTFIKTQQHLSVSIRNPQDFHISVTGEDDLYQLLTQDMILSDKLIIVILLNMLQFRSLHKTKFTSVRTIKPIQYINNCNHTFTPNIKLFKSILSEALKKNKQTIQNPVKSQELIVKNPKKSSSICLDQLQDNSSCLFDLLTLYQTIGINGDLSNRTTLLDYEDFQQKQFRKTSFVQKVNKTYSAGRQQSPLPVKYNYENYITYRRNKAITYDPPSVKEHSKSANTFYRNRMQEL